MATARGRILNAMRKVAGWSFLPGFADAELREMAKVKYGIEGIDVGESGENLTRWQKSYFNTIGFVISVLVTVAVIATIWIAYGVAASSGVSGLAADGGVLMRTASFPSLRT